MHALGSWMLIRVWLQFRRGRKTAERDLHVDVNIVHLCSDWLVDNEEPPTIGLNVNFKSRFSPNSSTCSLFFRHSTSAKSLFANQVNDWLRFGQLEEEALFIGGKEFACLRYQSNECLVCRLVASFQRATDRSTRFARRAVLSTGILLYTRIASQHARAGRR